MNFDTGDNIYQYKHEDNFNTAPASSQRTVIGGLTKWNLYELGSEFYEGPERIVPARNNCIHCDDRAERKGTDSNIVPPLERSWAERMLQQRREGVLLQREKCPVFADEKTRLGQNLGVASGDPSHQDNNKLTQWKLRARLRQYILEE